MKLDLSKKLLTFEGEEIMKEKDAPLTVGSAIASILGSTRSSDILRSFTLGSKLVNAKTVELDKSDLDFIKGVLKSTDQAKPIVVGQILSLLE